MRKQKVGPHSIPHSPASNQVLSRSRQLLFAQDTQGLVEGRARRGPSRDLSLILLAPTLLAMDWEHENAPATEPKYLLPPSNARAQFSEKSQPFESICRLIR